MEVSCESIVNRLNDKGISDVDAANHELHAMQDMINCSDEHIANFGRCGGFKAVVDVLAALGKENIGISMLGMTIESTVLSNCFNITIFGENGGSSVIVGLLGAHGKVDSSVALTGLKLLCVLAEFSSDIVSIIGGCGGCEVVISLLETHGQTDTDIARAGLMLVAQLSMDNCDNRVKLSLCGGFTIAIRLLKLKTTPTEIILPALKAIAALTTNNIDIVTKFIANAGCELIIATMDSFGKTQAEVAEYSFRIISNVTRGRDADSNRTKIGSCRRGCEIMMELLIQYGAGNIKVATEGLGAIANMTTSNAANNSKINSLDGCDCVLNLLSKYGESDGDVAVEGLSALANLTEDSGRSIFGRVSVAVFGDKSAALQSEIDCKRSAVVVNMLKKLGCLNIDVARHGLRVLINIITNKNNNSSGNVITQFGLSGGCEALILMLITHGLTDIDITSELLNVILLCSTSNADNAVKFGLGCGSIATTLDAHCRANNGVTLLGLKTLSTLTIASPVHAVSVLGLAPNGCKVVVAMIEAHGRTDLNVAQQGFVLANCLAGASDDIRLNFVDSRGCEAIVSLLDKHKSNLELAQKGFKVICNLSNNHCENAIRITTCDGFPAVVAMIEAHGKPSAEAAELGLNAISAMLEKNSECSVKLGQLGALEAVSTIMNSHGRANVRVLEHCMRAIANFTADQAAADNRSKLNSKCKLVVSNLQQFGLNATVGLATEGLRAVANLAVNNVQNQSALGARACDVVLTLLETKGTAHLSVAKEGLQAIENLCFDVCNLPNKLTFGARACQIVVGLLEVHGKTDSNVVEFGLRAMINMSSDCVDNKISFNVCKGCDVIVTLLNLHAASPQVCDCALQAICVLSTGMMEIIAKFGSLKGCETILTSISNHSATSLPVAERGLLAMAQLSHLNVDNCIIFGTKNCYEIVVTLLKTYGGSPGVLEGALRVIVNLSGCNGDHKTRFAACGVCEAITAVLVQHESMSTKNMILACRAVLNITLDDYENCVMFGACNGCEALVSTLGCVSDELVEHALRALCSVMILNKGNRALVMACGGCEAVLAVLTTHATHPRCSNLLLASEGLRIITLLFTNCSHDTAVRLISTPGMCEVLLTIFKLHCKNDTMMACSVLDILAMMMTSFVNIGGDAQTKLGACGACEAAVMVLQEAQTKFSMTLVERGLTVIAGLVAAGHVENKRRFAALRATRGIEGIVAAVTAGGGGGGGGTASRGGCSAAVTDLAALALNALR